MIAEEWSINVELSGDLGEMGELKRNVIVEHVNNFLSKYAISEEIEYIDVYIKKFDALHLGRPLIFCNITFNTQYGIVAEHGTAWGSKQALKQAMKNSMLTMEKLAEEQLLGFYGQPEVFS